jgi:hypothetical protein
MPKLYRFIALFIGIAACSVNVNAQGYKIKIHIPALKDSTVILGHYYANSSLYPDDTVKLDKKGMGVFKGNKRLPGGMYFIFFRKNLFEFLLSENQKFSIEADTSDFIKTVKFKGSPENQLFYGYQGYIANKRGLIENLNVQIKKAASPQQRDSISKEINNTSAEAASYTNKLISANPTLFLSTFLKALQKIEVPELPTTEKTKDSTFQARYYRRHYFDNIDLNDNRLLRTPIYEQKLLFYVDNVVYPLPDSICKDADMIIDRVRNNSEVFKYVLITLFNHFYSSKIMGYDAIYVHIAEKYYIPYATWSSTEFIEKLKKEVARKKPNLIGNTAPDIQLVEAPVDHFKAAMVDTALKSNVNIGVLTSLQSIQAKYLVVAFWEADCWHCKTDIPVLYDSIYPRLKDKGVKILAVHIVSSVEGQRKWIDFVNKYHMYDWINATPSSYEYKDLYDVASTPMIYVLDENKKIIAKHVSPKQAGEVIDFEIRKGTVIKK